MATANTEPAKFGAVFRVREFQALWFALLLSIAGDQLARVAIALLVYTRTHSPALTALTYALTFLPDLFGGPLLAGLADRYPRRTVMVVADVTRAALVGVMAIPGMPLAPVCVLLVAVQLLNSPFNAARAAVMPAMLADDLYIGGQAIMNITFQTGQLAGYVVGGALVAFTGSNIALAIDAGTFVVSAILVRFGLRHRPAALAEAGAAKDGTLKSLRAGAKLVFGSAQLRVLAALACLSAFCVVCEGLAVPYARELGGGALTAGLLFAAMPAGVAIGMFALTRYVPPPTRMRMLGPLAVASCAVLVVCVFHPNLVITIVVWMVAGMAESYQTIASAAFVLAVPDTGRGQAYGLVATAMRVTQGLAVVVAGAIAEAIAPSEVVAIFGIGGAVAAASAALAWGRNRDEVSMVRVDQATEA